MKKRGLHLLNGFDSLAHVLFHVALHVLVHLWIGLADHFFCASAFHRAESIRWLVALRICKLKHERN